MRNGVKCFSEVNIDSINPSMVLQFTNYRTISLKSVTGKVMEKLLVNSIMFFLQTNHLSLTWINSAIMISHV